MEKLYVLKWAIPCFSRLKPLNTLLKSSLESQDTMFASTAQKNVQHFIWEILGHDSDDILALQVTEKFASSD